VGQTVIANPGDKEGIEHRGNRTNQNFGHTKADRRSDMNSKGVVVEELNSGDVHIDRGNLYKILSVIRHQVVQPENSVPCFEWIQL